MNPKNTWILVALAVGLFAFIYFYDSRLTEPPPPSTKVLTDFKAADVTSIQILPAGIRADFTNGAWLLSEPLVYPARSAAIEDLLQGLEGLSSQLHFSAQGPRDNSKGSGDYGLDAPSITIMMQAGSELPRVLKFGNRTPPGDQIYAQLVAREGVDVVATDVLKLIPRQPNDWRDTTFADLKPGAFDRLAVTNGDKTLELQRDAASGFWHMTHPMTARADNSKIEDLVSNLKKLRVSRFETDDAKADFDSFGLQPPRWQLSFGQGTNTLMTFQLGKSPTNDDTQIYARVAGQNTVVQVPRSPLDPWCDDYEKFRDPRLVGLAAGGLDAIEVSGPENFRLDRVTNDIWVITANSRRLFADSALMHRFIEDMAKMRVVPINGQFAKDAVNEPDLPAYGLATPARKYVLKRSATGPGLVSTNLIVAAELQFAAEKDGKVFARRPEEKSVYAVEAAEVQRLPTRSLDLFERRVWNFAEGDVRRIIIATNGKIQKLAHAGTNQWIFDAGGQGIVNPFAIEEAAHALGTLKAARWIDCTNQNSGKFGFTDKSPRITVELFNADKPQLLSLELGGWSPDKRRYGMVSSGNESWIFEVPNEELQRIVDYLGIHENGP